MDAPMSASASCTVFRGIASRSLSSRLFLSESPNSSASTRSEFSDATKWTRATRSSASSARSSSRPSIAPDAPVSATVRFAASTMRTPNQDQFRFEVSQVSIMRPGKLRTYFRSYSPKTRLKIASTLPNWRVQSKVWASFSGVRSEVIAASRATSSRKTKSSFHERMAWDWTSR